MDKNKFKEGKGNRVLLTIIAVATLLISVVGATFAYFTAQLSTGTDEQIVIKTALIGTTFNGGNQINIANVWPQDGNIPLEPAGQNTGHTKEFTITVTGAAPEGTKNHYVLGMEIYSNSFDADDLKFKLTFNGVRASANGSPASDISITSVPVNSTGSVVSQSLGTGYFEWGSTAFPEGGVSHSYYLDIMFPNQDKEQSQGKTFQAWVSIAEAN